MTVGVAGLVQGGGFGIFSKGFGPVASGLLEAEAVTADGRLHTVNAGSEPDLFWALQGGGGGTFGVLTRVTLRTRDLPKYLGWTVGTIKAQSDAAFARLIARFIDFYHQALFNPHCGEQIRLGPDNTLAISMVSQGLDSAQASEAWQPFFDWVNASPGDFAVVYRLRSVASSTQDWPTGRSWWDVQGNPSMGLDTREGAPINHGWSPGDQSEVGAFLHGFDSLWLPASLLQPRRQQQLVDALLAARRHKLLRVFINKGLAGAPPGALAAARQTATNPLVVDAFAIVIIADGQAPAYPGLARPALDLLAARADAREIDLAAAALRKIAPGSGSCVSESNYFNRFWRTEYWGTNYPRLRAIKARYDPDGLFAVHHGVGSEDWSADGFTRLAG